MPLVLRVGSHQLELVPGRSYVIGSGETADVRLSHGSIAPQHVRVSLVDLKVRVVDLDSEHGTWHDGERISSIDIGLGTELRVGDIPLCFEQLVPAGAIAAADVKLEFEARHREASFNELMAEQLRRAPWFAISIFLHVLIGLILYLLLNALPTEPPRKRVFTLQPTEEAEDILDEDEVEEVVEEEEEINDVVIQQFENDSNFDQPEERRAFEEFDAFDGEWIGEGMLSSLRGGGGNDVLNELKKGGSTAKFKKRISGLRKSGLDIVFVFDSTQSMSEVLDETKQRISLMAEVLNSLVESARIGIVTYRDHGKHEEYLTRHVPLAADYYQAINFMQTVNANGGGDFPEAVFDAVKLASSQRWRKGAQRVIILIGDAPARDKSRPKLRSMVRSFARNNRSYVHAIMTARDKDGIDPETRENFEEIADAGSGSCIELEAEDTILRDVIGLAIGQSFRRDLDRIYQIVEKKRDRISASTRDMIKRSDVDSVIKAFSAKKVDDEVVRAVIEGRDSKIAKALVELLRKAGVRRQTRQAAAYAIQRLLDLTAPPIDPEVARPISQRQAESLTQRIDKAL